LFDLEDERPPDYAAALLLAAAGAFADGADAAAPRRLVRITRALLRPHRHKQCLLEPNVPNPDLGVRHDAAADVALELARDDAEAFWLYWSTRDEGEQGSRYR
jgi:hypothetical protein